MTTVALVLGAVALAGVVFLAFGYAASLRLIRDLQDRMQDATIGDAPRRLDFFARDRRSFVLVTEAGCVACTDRLADLARYVADGSAAAATSALSYTVLQARPGARPDVLPKAVEYVTDSGIVSKLGVGVVPMGLVFDRSGTEIGRSVLGDRQSFEQIVAWAANEDQKSETNPQPAGRG